MQQLNVLLNNSAAISEYYSKEYTGAINRYVSLNDADAVDISELDMYYKISGYELFDDNENNKKVLKDLPGYIINSLGASGSCFSFSLYNTPQKGINVFLGANHRYAPIIKEAITNNLFSAALENIWISPAESRAVQVHNGLIVGVCALESSDIDKVINTFTDKTYIINILCVPCKADYIRNEIESADRYLDFLQQITRTDMTVGTQRTRKLDNDRHDIVGIMEKIKKIKEHLNSCLLNGAWQIVVHVAAAEHEVYQQVSSSVSALFRSRGTVKNEITTPMVVNVDFPLIEKSTWKFPRAFLGKIDLEGILSNSLVNLHDSTSASSLTMLPIYSHNGYSVKHLGESSISTGAFDKFSPKQNSLDSFIFGKMPNGSDYHLPISDFRQHCFVTGTTQSGKSTSVKQVLIEAHKQGIAFIILEAAKKDYWRLTGEYGMNKIPVYSAGMDAKKLHINPFIPEENTRLEAHIQDLINALLSMFDKEDPLPQLLTTLVYASYEKKGWDTTKRVRADEKREYPTLSDLLTNLDECVEQIGYSEDVMKDMKGVVRVRLSSLIRQVGELLNTQMNISIKEMYETSAIVELDDFDDNTKPFISSILAIKVNEFSKQCRMENQLRRILVVEEAHHIIPSHDYGVSSPNSQRCAKYFTNMLAEVSAYGTGIIAVDQRASAISSAALANTGLKIIHNVRQGDDIDAVARSMSLKEHEKVLLNKLNIGQAVVSLPQTVEVCKVNINTRRETPLISNIGCLFCNVDKCDDIKGSVSPYEDNLLKRSGITIRNIELCVSSIEERYSMSLTQSDKVCLIGRLVTKHTDNEMITRQQLFDYLEILKEKEG